jgi:hypothetical protein
MKPAERERFFKKLREDAPAWLKETWGASKRRRTDIRRAHQEGQSACPMNRSCWTAQGLY